MRIIDISNPIHTQSVVWPGDKAVAIRTNASFAKGDAYNITSLSLSAHTGTHVDAPSHFIQEGATLDQVELSRFCGPALVVEVSGDAVDAQDVEAAPIRAGDIVLFKTKNSKLWQQAQFVKDFVYLTKEAAQVLVERQVKGVGIDYLSIAQYGHEAEVHRIVLGAELGVIEGLNLSGVKPGRYIVAALPLKIQGGDGSPVRAVLLDGLL